VRIHECCRVFLLRHATVQLPEWFSVLNKDFRYQLTVIGQFAQAIVAREIEGNHFEIRTSAPNIKVSWQVTGVRQDAYAKANPLVVEQEKGARLRGYYIHPEFYGAPPEKQIEWARHPEIMKRINKTRAKQSAAKTSPTQ
jgi:trimeric autotransporter adhesin